LSDGEEPAAGLIMDRHGALYGTAQYGGYGYGALVDGQALVPPAQGYGAVFKLEPPDWKKEAVLYRFAGGQDGYAPQAALTLDPPTGALYGTTANGGVVTHTDPADEPLGGGTVFKLSPPDQDHPDGWRESVLYSFTGPPDGAFPRGGLIADAAGNLYGTTEWGGAGAFGYGVVFRLSPTGSGPTGWTETVLYKFDGSRSGDGPLGELVGGPGGHLFGVTWEGGGGGGGTLFELTP
jgi:uncharacterized repeat protein (TIGR03803 family)